MLHAIRLPTLFETKHRDNKDVPPIPCLRLFEHMKTFESAVVESPSPHFAKERPKSTSTSVDNSMLNTAYIRSWNTLPPFEGTASVLKWVKPTRSSAPGALIGSEWDDDREDASATGRESIASGFAGRR